MSSLIERAAQRLEQLRRAGIEVPASGALAPSARVSSGPRAAPSAGPAASEARLPSSQPVSKRVTLDTVRLDAAGLSVPGATRSLLTDQYRVIKRPLLRNAKGRGAATVVNGNLIMITSALPAEGKSFTAVNLAMSIAAELDHTVMLVDADVAKPSLPRMLGIDPGPGLLDVLDGSEELSSVLLRTDVEGLTVLRAGTHHPRATELLASEAMRQLLHEMATRYPERIIVFDSPPLLPTTEARALASHMGQVVLVVHAERTLQSQVERALATIDACPLRLLLLNQARGAAEEVYAYGYSDSYTGPVLPASNATSIPVPANAAGQGA
jgi:exopolysaccharide/PEP-CTERM locus tyrosine autokinase